MNPGDLPLSELIGAAIALEIVETMEEGRRKDRTELEREVVHRQTQYDMDHEFGVF